MSELLNEKGLTKNSYIYHCCPVNSIKLILKSNKLALNYFEFEGFWVTYILSVEKGAFCNCSVILFYGLSQARRLSPFFGGKKFFYVQILCAL